MKLNFLCTVIMVFLFTSTVFSQTSVAGVNLDLGISGGVSIPNGILNGRNNSGYHWGAKGRIRGLTPLNIVASGNYNRLPNKVGGESDIAMMVGVGLELPVPSVVVNPYFGIDALWNRLSSTNSGVQASSRVGIGAGAGVDFSIPGLGSFETSIKYQMFNLLGKDDREETLSQITGSVTLMFSVF
jgi:hypothetical protein